MSTFYCKKRNNTESNIIASLSRINYGGVLSPHSVDPLSKGDVQLHVKLEFLGPEHWYSAA